jgi:spore maturation protein SpmA
MKEKPSPINIVWMMMVVLSVIAASWTGKMDLLTTSIFDSAKAAVTLAIGLIGAMALWLGIMKVMEEAGALKLIARAVRPVMKKLFPEVPHDHPAMSSMIMNIAANMLGLGNAATPLGIKAMTELDKLNPVKGRATNAMCLFLAINTSSVTLLPLGVIVVRSAAGASNPASILIPSILATSISTITAIFAVKFFQKRTKEEPLKLTPEKATASESIDMKVEKSSRKGKVLVSVFALLIFLGMIYRIINFEDSFSWQIVVSSISAWLIPIIMVTFLLYGYLKGVKLYETVAEGGKEGFKVAIKIIPFMVAIFVAVGMLRSSGALEIMVKIIDPITSLIGMPAESLTVALLRPLSGSGAFAVMSEIVNSDPNSFLSFLVSTMQGSTETTFYVLALYFGAVGIKNARHAIPAALIADAAGILGAVLLCNLFWG